MNEQPKLKNIYKKSLAMKLIRRGNDLHHTMRNCDNPKWQVFCLYDTPQLRKDLADLTGHTYEE